MKVPIICVCVLAPFSLLRDEEELILGMWLIIILSEMFIQAER